VRARDVVARMQRSEIRGRAPSARGEPAPALRCAPCGLRAIAQQDLIVPRTCRNPAFVRVVLRCGPTEEHPMKTIAVIPCRPRRLGRLPVSAALAAAAGDVCFRRRTYTPVPPAAAPHGPPVAVGSCRRPAPALPGVTFPERNRRSTPSGSGPSRPSVSAGRRKPSPLRPLQESAPDGAAAPPDRIIAGETQHWLGLDRQPIGCIYCKYGIWCSKGPPGRREPDARAARPAAAAEERPDACLQPLRASRHDAPGREQAPRPFWRRRNLIAVVWRGREKLHYLNSGADPRRSRERWIGKFERSRPAGARAT